jgi:hypothetical protein
MTSCPNSICNGVLIPLRSINKKICSGCKTYYEFSLKVGQKTLIKHTR